MLLVGVEVTSMTLCNVVHKARALSFIIDSKIYQKDESKVDAYQPRILQNKIIKKPKIIDK